MKVKHYKVKTWRFNFYHQNYLGYHTFYFTLLGHRFRIQTDIEF